MDAVEFFKTVNRLCKNQSCEECPVYKNDMCCMVGFDDDSIKNIGETVSKVEQWAKDHPVRTRQSEFLKMFPAAPVDRHDGTLCIDPCAIDSTQKGNKYCNVSCTTCRKNYWLTEAADND